MNKHQDFQFKQKKITKDQQFKPEFKPMKSAPPVRFQKNKMSIIKEEQSNESDMNYSQIRKSRDSQTQFNRRISSNKQSKNSVRRPQQSSKISNEKQVGNPSEIKIVANSDIQIDLQDQEFTKQLKYRPHQSTMTRTAPQKNQQNQPINELRVTHIKYDTKKSDLLPTIKQRPNESRDDLQQQFLQRGKVGDSAFTVHDFGNRKQEKVEQKKYLLTDSIILPQKKKPSNKQIASFFTNRQHITGSINKSSRSVLSINASEFNPQLYQDKSSEFKPNLRENQSFKYQHQQIDSPKFRNKQNPFAKKSFQNSQSLNSKQKQKKSMSEIQMPLFLQKQQKHPLSLTAKQIKNFGSKEQTNIQPSKDDNTNQNSRENILLNGENPGMNRDKKQQFDQNQSNSEQKKGKNQNLKFVQQFVQQPKNQQFCLWQYLKRAFA